MFVPSKSASIEKKALSAEQKQEICQRKAENPSDTENENTNTNIEKFFLNKGEDVLKKLLIFLEQQVEFKNRGFDSHPASYQSNWIASYIFA